MTTKTSTRTRIFDGAIRALARQGPRKLTMNDIADEAGVSVGTLYRYFKNKDELLRSLGDHFVAQLQATLEQAIVANPKPADRLEIVVDVMLRFWLENPATVQIGQVEPAFVLEYIRRVAPKLAAVLHDAIEPVLKDSSAVLSGSLTLDEVADLVVRMAFSHYFMPSNSYEEFRDVFVALGISAGLEPRKTRVRRTSKAAAS